MINIYIYIYIPTRFITIHPITPLCSIKLCRLCSTLASSAVILLMLLSVLCAEEFHRQPCLLGVSGDRPERARAHRRQRRGLRKVRGHIHLS
jgi:hypothetical protein